MTYRGPDDEGYYLHENVGLAMRRLSIIDLSTGHQPITNEDGTMWIVFNGEVYNFQPLREDLEAKGHVFKTLTDTEAILHAYEEYGEACVERLIGMFAFAIYDEKRRRLFIARDRLGIKPLYYARINGEIYFGSELKVVLQHPGVPRDLDMNALDQFLTLEYIPAPRSIVQHVQKLPPGHTLTYEDGEITIKSYWSLDFQTTTQSDEESLEELTELIRDAVKLRMIADVPLGAFLSGGIDSSTVVSFMSELSSLPVKTFSIGFGDPTYNELPYARMVAQHYGTEHYEEYLEPDVLSLAERLIRHLDEPLGDFSILPTYLVSEVARKHVTVSLSGDGGDEIFAGYDTYVAQNMARYYNYVPGPIREKVLPAIMSLVPPQSAKKGLINKAKRFIEGGALDPELQHTRWMMFINDADKDSLYQAGVRSAIATETPQDVMERYFLQARIADALAQQQYVDIKTYLADDILTKVDRMSMAVSLEARVPLLDHRVVEFAMRLPPHLRMDKGTTKVILRKLMANRLPEQVLNKPKEGFSIPIKQWLKTTLNPLMMDLLSQSSVQRRGYFHSGTVERWIKEHMENKANHSHRLWALMVFELWQREVLDTPVPV